jgi:hypothetical protein
MQQPVKGMLMHRRLYFVLPDTETANKLEHDLLLAHVDDHHMHFLAKPGTDLGNLTEATNFEKSDVKHGMLVGAITGGSGGGLCGLILYLNPDFIGIPIGFGVMPLFMALGAAFGCLTSGFLIGSSAPNVYLKEFDRDFELGRILAILDVQHERVGEIQSLIKERFPSAQDHGAGAATSA